MASILPAIITEALDERRYFQSINIVASALALRFDYVAPGLVCIRGNADSVLALGCVIERINGSEGITYTVGVFSGRGGR